MPVGASFKQVCPALVTTLRVNQSIFCRAVMLPDCTMIQLSNKEYQLTGKIKIRQARMSGFTLLELLVVMVIIGLLAAYVGPKYFRRSASLKSRPRWRRWMHWARRWISTVWMPPLPSSEMGLAALFTRPSNEPKWVVHTCKRMCLWIHGETLCV